MSIMKNPYTLLITLLFFVATPTHARPVEKCIDNDTGKVTYTDKGCKNKEVSKEAYLVGTDSKKNNSKSANSAKNTSVSYRVSEIGLLTEQASEQCAKHAGKYLAESQPEISQISSESEFLTVVDRSIRGDNVEIILSGNIPLKGEKENQSKALKCVATKSRDSEWVVVFKDIAASSTAEVSTGQ